ARALTYMSTKRRTDGASRNAPMSKGTTTAAASDRQAPVRGLFAGAAIDCDVHVSVPSMKALIPYLDDYWREAVLTRGLDRHNMSLTGQPANAPLFGRPDWKPQQGAPGTDLATLQREALDAFGTKYAILNCMYG